MRHRISYTIYTELNYMLYAINDMYDEGQIFENAANKIYYIMYMLLYKICNMPMEVMKFSALFRQMRCLGTKI
jgi:hypothetical protein